MNKEEFIKKIEEEGDYLEWTYQTKYGPSYDCFIRRNKSSKSLCGYIKLTKLDYYYGKEYLDIGISVHGGLTFGELEDDIHIIGFDCAHYNDLTFYDYLKDFKTDGVYRSMNYVKKQCESMAEQACRKSPSKIRDFKIGKIV